MIPFFQKSYFKSLTSSCCLIFIIISCHESKIKKEEESVTVSVDIVLHHTDIFQLFYLVMSDDSYTEENSIKKQIIGSDKLQTVIWKIPKGIKPKNLRIDVGDNYGVNDSIIMHNIRIRHKNIEIYGGNEIYKEWFNKNDNIIYGKSNDVLYLRASCESFDPILQGNHSLNAKLVKLFPPEI